MADMSLAEIVVLGIVEGVTEFLPVSSTGHLILAGELLGLKESGQATFEIAIQSGAILAVLVAYARRFRLVIGGLFRRDVAAIAFVRNILLGFVPAAVIGLILLEQFEKLLDSPLTVGVALVVGGVAILLIERYAAQRVAATSVEEVPARSALLVGLGQCLAMIPGISRSGATIMTGLLLGMDRKTAAEFSFFLALPTIGGATALLLWKHRDELSTGDLGAIAIGFTVSFVVALAVVKGFVTVVSRYGFAPFAWYRIVVGGVAIVWLLAR